jgi:hypothetical protein
MLYPKVARGFRSGRYRRGFIRSAGLGMFWTILLMGLTLWRVNAPTEAGWMLFPPSREGLICQNWIDWYLGRSYGEIKAYDAILEATRFVRATIPEARVAYMEASGRRRGRFWPHLSHRNGIDVDILYFGREPDGRIYPTQSSLLTVGYMLNYMRDRHCGNLTYDAHANWLFLEGLYHNHSKNISMIFVEPYIRKWLLDEGRTSHADAKLMTWAEDHLLYAGANSDDHMDHFHVRFVNDQLTK